MDSMTPTNNATRAAITISAIDTARKLLRYSFVEINFAYDQLTEVEQELCTKEEFDVMVRQFRLR